MGECPCGLISRVGQDWARIERQRFGDEGARGGGGLMRGTRRGRGRERREQMLVGAGYTTSGGLAATLPDVVPQLDSLRKYPVCIADARSISSQKGGSTRRSLIRTVGCTGSSGACKLTGVGHGLGGVHLAACAIADGSGRIIMDSAVMPEIIPMWISGAS